MTDPSDDVLSRWLDALDPGAGPRWGPVLSALPLRPTFEPPPAGADARLYAVEASLRVDARGEVSSGLRLAVTLDPARLPSSWLPALARRVAPPLGAHDAVAEVTSLLRTGRLDGLLFGVDGAARAKFYLYGTDADGLTRDLGLPADDSGLATAFVAVDLLPDGRRAVKRYLRAPDRRAAEAGLRRLGARDLGAQAAALPAAVDGVPHGLVLTLRHAETGPVDVTLHARAEGLGDAVATLAGAALCAGLARVRAAVPDVDVRVTHLAWLSSGARSLYGVPRGAPGMSR